MQILLNPQAFVVAVLLTCSSDKGQVWQHARPILSLTCRLYSALFQHFTSTQLSYCQSEELLSFSLCHINLDSANRLPPSHTNKHTQATFILHMQYTRTHRLSTLLQLRTHWCPPSYCVQAHCVCTLILSLLRESVNSTVIWYTSCNIWSDSKCWNDKSNSIVFAGHWGHLGLIYSK